MKRHAKYPMNEAGGPRRKTQAPSHGVLKPGLTLGILGGGQLGRMLAIAAANLGMKAHIFAPEAESPAFEVSARQSCAPYSDRAALHAFAEAVDVITFEFENVPTATLDRLRAHAPRLVIAPAAAALSITQDRVSEKTFMQGLGLETAPFAAIDSLTDLESAVAKIGTPAILKTRRMGYDGKGQARIADKGGCAAAYQAIGGQPAILEGFVSFAREISVLAARGMDGSVVIYDVCENEHRNHILSRTIVPARIAVKTDGLAREAAQRIVTALDYVGLLAVEMFVVGDGSNERVVMNEIAPRVHNSGHWTIEGAETSQFEQHVRAVMNLPLGSAARCGAIRMDNLLGEDMHRVPELLGKRGAHLHLYGKKQARKGRKMGHVTFVSREESPKASSDPVWPSAALDKETRF